MTSKDNLANLSPAEKRKLLAELLAKQGGNAPRIFPLASGQKALWLMHQQDPAGAAYNTPFALRLRSEIDPAALKRSFQLLAARHPSLRTTFAATPDGQLLQTVHPTLEPHFQEISAKGWSPEQLHEEVVRAYRRPFSLEKGPLFRGDLFTVGPADHVLLITIHHIVYDAWSAQILQRELSQIYLTLSKGGAANLAPVRGNYQDFVAKQTELVAGPVGRTHLDYWQKKLSGELPLLALPSDRSRSARAESRAGASTFRLDAALTMGIKALAHSEQATPFAVLLAAYSALLGRLSGQDDVLVGSPTTGRPGVEAHDVVGYYANPVVLRADLSGSPSSRALIGRLRTVVLDALAHQDYPFASLVERLEHARRPGVSPIFQASISLQSSQEGAEAMELWATPDEGARIRWGHVELEPYPLKDQEGQFDLTLEMWEARGTFAGVFRFNKDLFDESTVKLWRSYFEQLIAAMVRSPDTEIARLSLAAPEKTAAVSTPVTRQGPAQTINAVFARQVARRPEAIALALGEARLSYAELDARANVLAHELAQRGVGPESLVGVCVDRSLELVVAILGVVKAGGAYVPLDPASPKDRLGMILEDADVAVLITETKRAAELPTEKVPTIFVDALRWAEGQRAQGPAVQLNPDHAAYVIYTSGSTGKPKGVIVTHANVTRLFTTTEGLYDFGENDVWTLFHSAAFDFSVWELWGALLYGGRLLVIPHWMSRSPEAFAELIDREGVTVLNQTPSAFRQLLRAPSMAGADGGRSLRWVIFGGEALDAATVRPWFERHPGGSTRLVNMYGITETTVHVTYHLVSPTELGSSQSLIGEPIPDLRILLLDAHGAPVPVGVPGEIYVGGAGVARGYLKRPELTAQRFLPDPEHPGRKLYRSGDLAIRLPGGGYNYLGRMDHQVKIRGFRIELGEIQSLLSEHPAVAEAFVMTFDKSEDDRRLVAYVVPKAGAAETLLSAESDGGAKDTHVNEWQELYDELYARSATDQSTDLSFNIAGWNSSYSGAPLSAEAMKEWVDRTVAQVLERKPARVLEIGSGSGLLLTRIAPHTKAYVGTDVSKVVVELVSGYAKRTPGLEHAKLYACPADELDRLDLGAERFDAVIINSVVQYFPSGDYLAKVLENAVARVAPGGFVFVGDVRNLRLLEAFHASILLAQSTGAIDPAVMKERVARRIAAEEELVLDPDFFWGLRERAPRISHVEVRPKRGACQNELTRFRYDVVLHVEAEPVAPPEVSWGPGSVGLLELRERLSQAAAPRVGLRGIRNARVQAALEATTWLTEAAASDRGSAEKLRRRVIDRDSSSAPIDAEPGVDPEALHRLAEALNLEVFLDWSRGGQDGSYDAVFSPRPASPALAPVAWFGAAPELNAAKPRASDPLRGRVERRLETELRKRAQDRLPEYMVPASIMVVDRIPLTENGKVDRRALPAPATPQELGVAYVEPRTGEEEILCSVFAELLGAERVGVRDSFFDLGGHSLLATQVVSRIRSVFGVDLPLRALFENPTVEGLAAAVHSLHRQSAGTPLVELSQPLPRPERIPLSSSQERMWILDRVEETRSPIYVIPLVLRLRGPLDERALRSALGTIVARHEALRTSFPTMGELPVQQLSADLVIDLPRAEPLELPAGLSEQEQLEGLQRAVGLEVSRPFDLARGPVLRLRLFRLSELDHVLVLTMHHIVSDGWSIGVLARELSAAYGAFKAGREPVLPALPVQYADFALWQRQALESGALASSIAAYQQRLLGAPPFLELPADRPRPAAPSFQGGVVRFQLDRGLTTRLKDLSRREGATLYMTLLAAYSTYLSRVSGQSDLVIGSPVANRNRAATEPLIGLFVNTLALRVNLAGDPSFLELLARVRKTTLDAYADQDVPFEKIVEAVSPERSLNRQPVVQAMFVLQNAPFSPPQLDGLSVEMLELDSITSKFDLTLSMQETPDGLSGLIEFSAEIFDRARIERMSRHLGVILENAVKEPKRRVQELSLLDAAEEKNLAAWSDGGPALEAERSLLEQFEAQVKARPEAPAIVADGVALSYAELNQRAVTLGRCLASKGVAPEVLVAIALPRSVDLVVSILAIWKAGGAYLPIDPDYPEARVAHMLDDSRVKLVISHRSVAAAARWSQERVWLDEPIPAVQAPLSGVARPSQMAYVIYTSGSTGKPKGVVVEHRGLGNVAEVQVARFGLGPDSAVLSFASPSFDASVWELAMALGSGARLVISTNEAARAGEGLATLLTSAAVSHATLPPSTLAALPGDRDYPALRVLISAGEACTPELVKRWSTSTRRFFNAYGPTETTICATMEECSPADGRVSIGGPLPGFTVRILDQARRPVPIGVPGELCVGGVGLARAYLHREELSRERFIEVEGAGGKIERLYTTGDLGRFTEGGRIEYLGRLDHQVKLRGYRIELGEIEAILEAHPEAQQALALVHKNQLVAYVVPRAGQQPTIASLLEAAHKRLPDYMVPTQVVLLEAFPLTPNGKIDRAKLPDPEQAQAKVAYAAPDAPLEQILAEIWSEVLKKSPIGVHDNFFQLGGDSILGLQIIARATQRGLRLRPRQLFQHQTIAELAKVAGAESAIVAEQGLVEGVAPLTPIQRWFFEQERAEPQHYNMALLLEVSPRLDPALLAKALGAVERQHDALRLRYHKEGEAWVQAHVAPSEALRLVVRELPSAAELGPALAELHQSLRLESGPVFSALFARLGDGTARLALVAHHLVIDGVSWGPILEDLLLAYAAFERGEAPKLPAKTTSFKQWSEQLLAYAETPGAKTELDAWLSALDREGKTTLPMNEASASDTVGEASTIATWLSPEETKALLSEAPKAFDVKVNEVLIAALARALASWCGQSSARLDIEGHGRELFEDLDLSRTVGWFTALYPFLVRVGAKESARETLARVKDGLRRIPHGGVGFGVLRYLSPDASVRARLAALPRAEVAFNYLGQLGQIPAHSVVLGAAKEGLGPLHSPRAKRPHRLEINAVVTAEGLRVNWTFGAEVFTAESIERLSAAFISNLRGLLKDSAEPAAAAVRVGADFPAARVSNKDLQKLLNRTRTPRS